MVCTSGNPASAAWGLLRDLVKQGALVRYRGDFDWPGTAIDGKTLAAGAQPGRMSAVDYEDTVARLARLEQRVTWCAERGFEPLKADPAILDVQLRDPARRRRPRV